MAGMKIGPPAGWVARSWALCTVLVSVNCSAGGLDERFPSRSVVMTQWDTLWQTTPTFADSVSPSPRILTFNRGRLFVFDDAIMRLSALNASDGTLLWSAGRAGQGPEEFLGAAGLLPDSDGGVAIVDVRNHRLTRVSGEGGFVGSVPLGSIGQQPNQICVLKGSRFLVADVFEPMMLTMNASGELTEKMSPIWLDLVGSSIETRQVILRNDPAGTTCLAALTSGRGFAILSAKGDPIVAQYVERFDAYGAGDRAGEAEQKWWATFDAELVADTAFILFLGRTASLYRIVDRYATDSGRYLDTFLLPFETVDIAAGDGVIFAIDSSGTSVVALRGRR